MPPAPGFKLTPLLSFAIDLPLAWVDCHTLSLCRSPTTLGRLQEALKFVPWIEESQQGQMILRTGTHSQISELLVSLTEQQRQLSTIAANQNLLPCFGNPTAEHSLTLQLGAGDGDTALQLAQWWRPCYALLALIIDAIPCASRPCFLPAKMARWKDLDGTLAVSLTHAPKGESFAICPNPLEGTLDIRLDGVLPSPSQALELAAFAQTFTAYLLAEAPAADSDFLRELDGDNVEPRTVLAKLILRLHSQSIPLRTQLYLDAIASRLARTDATESPERLRTPIDQPRTCLAWPEH